MAIVLHDDPQVIRLPVPEHATFPTQADADDEHATGWLFIMGVIAWHAGGWLICTLSVIGLWTVVQWLRG